MDWDKLRVFHAVAEAGSFTHAGDTLNLSQSAVSRQISALEEALQVPLFHRHARGLILTEQGESLNRTVREVFAKLAMTEALLTESKEKPAGRLKVTTTMGFGSSWLAPRLHAFLETYPDVSVSLLLDDAELDLAMREADVAIRMHPPKQPDLVQRHLMTLQWHIVAAPEYLKRHGVPQRAEELDAHRLVLSATIIRRCRRSTGWRRQAAARATRAARCSRSTVFRRCCWPSARDLESVRCPIMRWRRIRTW